jgi:hypothetical protein
MTRCLFERLAQRLQRPDVELRSLVEEEHAAVGLERPPPTWQAAAAADESGDGRGVVRVLEGRAAQQPRSRVQGAGHRMDGCHLECLDLRELREQTGQTCGQHCLARPWRAYEQQVMATGSRDLKGMTTLGLPHDVREIGDASLIGRGPADERQWATQRPFGPVQDDRVDSEQFI